MYMYSYHVCVLPPTDFFSQNNLFRNFLIRMPSVSNSLDQDQVGHFIESDLGPKRLQRLSADDSSGFRKVNYVGQMKVFITPLYHFMRTSLNAFTFAITCVYPRQLKY